MKIYFHLSLSGFSNSYIITNEATQEAIIVDPGTITKEIISQIEDNSFKLSAVLVTHNHPSHVRGIATLRRIYMPKIYAADYQIAGSSETMLTGSGSVKIAGLTVGYMSVPGHTSDSMVYRVGCVLFTGDALTAGLIGETNNAYAERILAENITSKLFPQNDDFVIMPGHGPPSSVGAEKRYNILLGTEKTEASPPRRTRDK
ncbi:MAG: MBL fold metallo-hydrolase [Bacteroides sp.]|nr:MBL fold metallo-hydrolase [Prevotella sp.]MCM1407528.1 MBL fold metallo-hydrolase [Treponema brennaborense]MCM1470018.1 MBL fold metallo-hydrolase [Bacteroides sp.]